MNSFNEMGLSASTLASLDAMKITVPTPIQAQTIPLSLGGKDVIGSAQTAAGKTLAFSIPLVERMLTSPEGTALVLVPTRELAQQVMVVIRQVVQNKPGLKTALLIGGEAIFNQLRQLRQKPRIVVGTPGRVIDHLERGTYKAQTCNFLVLDEADRMVDMGFAPQIEEIINQMPTERQTLMFSATLDNAINNVASRYMQNPERVVIGKTSTPAPTIHQEIMHMLDSEKYDTLLEQLNDRDGSIVIFVNTKVGADKLAHKLTTQDNQRALAIHGGLRQNKREKVLADFRNGKSRVMIATDVAARGLNIPRIQHVINYDIPLCPEDYIHRIGRTSRSGEKGFAISMVTPKDGRKWQVIDRFMRQSMGGKTTHTQTRSQQLLAADAERQNAALNRSNGRRFDGESSEQRPRRGFSFRRHEDGERGEERSERPFRSRSFGGRERDERKPRFGKRNAENDEASGEKKPFFSRERNRTNDRFEGRSFGKKRFDREDRGERPHFDGAESDSREGSFKKRDFGSRGMKRGFGGKPFGKPSYDKPSFGKSGFGQDRSEDRGEKRFGKPRRRRDNAESAHGKSRGHFKRPRRDGERQDSFKSDAF